MKSSVLLSLTIGGCHLWLQFWKENVAKFEEKEFQILRVLLKLLEASRETRTLAVGCHDMGQFITYHESGRAIVTGGAGCMDAGLLWARSRVR